MKLLFAFDQRHPSLTPIVGSISGLLSWLIAHSPEIASVAGAIGAVATAGIALISFTRMLCRGIAAAAARVRQLARNHVQRRAWRREQLEEDKLS